MSVAGGDIYSFDGEDNLQGERLMAEVYAYLGGLPVDALSRSDTPPEDEWGGEYAKLLPYHPSDEGSEAEQIPVAA